MHCRVDQLTTYGLFIGLDNRRDRFGVNNFSNELSFFSLLTVSLPLNSPRWPIRLLRARTVSLSSLRFLPSFLAIYTMRKEDQSLLEASYLRITLCLLIPREKRNIFSWEGSKFFWLLLCESRDASKYIKDTDFP